MKTNEARAILRAKLEELRCLDYSELTSRLLNQQQVEEVVGSAGTRFYIEVQALIEDKRRGHLRVLASIDDGGLRSFVPVTDDFIIAPDGSFVGE